MFKTLEELIAVIRQRKTSKVEESYTKKLLSDKNLSIEKEVNFISFQIIKLIVRKKIKMKL